MTSQNSHFMSCFNAFLRNSKSHFQVHLVKTKGEVIGGQDAFEDRTDSQHDGVACTGCHLAVPDLNGSVSYRHRKTGLAAIQVNLEKVNGCAARTRHQTACFGSLQILTPSHAFPLAKG